MDELERQGLRPGQAPPEALPPVRISVGGREIVLRDYTSRKYDDFLPVRRNQKYYLNKSDYLTAPERKTKGNEKTLPAVKALVARRDMFKNKYQKMSLLDFQISKKLLVKPGKKKALGKMQKSETIAEVSSSSESSAQESDDDEVAELPEKVWPKKKVAIFGGDQLQLKKRRSGLNVVGSRQDD